MQFFHPVHVYYFVIFELLNQHIMKNLFLKFKTQIAKVLLSILGFTLAASQCLAQYMAIRPQTNNTLRLTGIADTNSRFRHVVNDYDTLYCRGKKNIFIITDYRIYDNKCKVEICEDSPISEQRFETAQRLLQ
jgi:hypothetical protein